MSITGDSQQRIDAYLGRLRTRLHGIHEVEILEIVEELRSHILDKAAAAGQAHGEITLAGVDAALAALGSADELASQYMTDTLLARAEVSRSPVRILKSLFRWGSLSVAGFLVLLVSIVGYGTGVSFFLVALLKPLHPETAGLWIWRVSGNFTYSVRLGFGAPPAGARELLGWWIVPIGFSLGIGLVMLTTHFALWCVGQYRKSQVLPWGN